MDSKKLRKGGESHKFMEKFFTKLKMTKHGSDEKSQSQESKKVTPSSSSSSSSTSDSKPLIFCNYTKINADNLMQFSDQLQQLLQCLQEMKEVTFYTYDYPNQLNTKLEKEAMELRSLFRDVRAAAIDIDRLKKQRHVVKKEKSTAQKRLDKLREEEIKELESIINVYAKPLYCKWESIKNTQKPEVLENFMNEVVGKHTAMEILQELIKRRLNKLVKKQATSSPFALKRNISSSNMGNKMKNQERTTSSWNITNAQELVKATPQAADRSVKQTAERDIIRVNRRKRQREMREDRRRQNAENVNGSSNNGGVVGGVGGGGGGVGGNSNNASGGNAENASAGGLDLQLVPIDGMGNDEMDDVAPSRAVPTTNVAATRSPPVVNIEYASDDDSVSLTSSDFIIENFVHGANADMQTDLQNEMRSVLQALFGEIRQIPQLSYGGRNRHNSGNDLRSPRTASH